MADRKIVTVTGATGHIGARLTELLLAAGHGVRAIGRDAGRLDPLAARGAEPRAGSLEDAAFLTGAFTGADVVEATHILGAAIGMPELPYVVFSPEDELQGLIGAGLSPSVASDLVEMHGGFNQGLFVPTLPRSPESTTPTTLEAWAPTFAAAYAGAG